MEALKKIQQELKAPKGQYNSFGKYAYRSAEDILEAVKPLLSKYGALLTISDEISEVGGRIYVKAVCTISDGTTELAVTAYAREPESKKGMDDSQITGTASSYARKYALNGLFLIDDTKDADTDEYAKQQNSSKPPQKIGKATVQTIEGLITQTNSDKVKLLSYFRVAKIEDMTQEQAQKCVAMLKSKTGGK